MFSSRQPQPNEEEEDQEEQEDQTNFLGFCSFCVELVGGTSKKQNWKGLGIALIVIAVVCLFITGAIFLTTTQQIPIPNEFLPITEEDLFNVKTPKPWNGTWISNKSFSYMDTDGSTWIYNCETLKRELVLKRDMVQQESPGQGILSPSARYILMPIRKGKMRPYYTEYQYDIYEKWKMIGSIVFPEDQKVFLSTVLYSHSDNLFVFIHNFDVYVYNIIKKKTNRITMDGDRDTIHNGLVEWIYEYEIFNRNVLLFWSPTDRYLAYIKINLTNLPKNHYLKYHFTDDGDDQYSIPYPKYNDPIPILDVYIYNIRSAQTIRVPRPTEYEKLTSPEIYIYHLVWYCDTCLAIVYGNRKQNSSLIQLYEISKDQIIVKSKYVEEKRRGFLLARFLQPFFSSNGAYAYIIRYDLLNMNQAFPSVVRIDFNQSFPQIDVKSSANIIADEIIHVNQFGEVYFTGSTRHEPLEKHLYRWTYINSISKTECLSCNESCGYASARFSRGNGSYYIFECYGPSIPYSILYNRTQRLMLINDNGPFQEWANHRLMPYIDYFSVPLDGKNTVGHGMIILPPKYSSNTTIASYPVIITINDRFADRRVTKKYILPIAEFIHVIQDNLGIVIFDAHGSTCQDERYFQNNYQDWFERQYEDYVKVAKHLKWNEKKFNETLNDTRFGLRARGPAAVIALKLLEEKNQVKSEYICAFLQSPVNDLSHYHAMYTERISGLKTGVTSSHRLNVYNQSLAIVHGTADEVVHFKHSATLVKSLIDTGIQYDFKVYPDVNHYLEEDPVISRDFLHYQRQFFRECLGGRVNRERKIIIPEEHD